MEHVKELEECKSRGYRGNAHMDTTGIWPASSCTRVFHCRHTSEV